MSTAECAAHGVKARGVPAQCAASKYQLGWTLSAAHCDVRWTQWRVQGKPHSIWKPHNSDYFLWSQLENQLLETWRKRFRDWINWMFQPVYFLTYIFHISVLHEQHAFILWFLFNPYPLYLSHSVCHQLHMLTEPHLYSRFYWPENISETLYWWLVSRI